MVNTWSLLALLTLLPVVISTQDLVSRRPARTCSGCTGGGTGDVMLFDISTQDALCAQEERSATRDGRWSAGLSLDVDRAVLGGEVVAYQIRWFNGQWSPWYVPGRNDIDTKVNTASSASSCTLRRMWSYFYDHRHRYILCQ